MNDYPLPYFAVIFTSKLSADAERYDEMAEKMFALAKKQEGFLGLESARSSIGITISYWKTLESIESWRKHIEHQKAIKKGKEEWYEEYKIRVCSVVR